MVISELWIRKYVEGSGRGLILRSYPGICLQRLSKERKTSDRIVGLRAEIWTWDFPNTKQEF
jgi:hypothetical protein